MESQNGTSETLMSESQAKTILDSVESKSPERWPAAIKTLVVKAYGSIEILFAAIGNLGTALQSLGVKHDKLLESHKRLVRVVAGLQAGTSQPSSPRAEETAAAPSEETPKSEEVGAAQASDMPEAQKDVEAAMDAAIAAAAAEKAGQAPSAGAKRRGK